MANTIKLKRGLSTNLQVLLEGEPAFCTDTKEMFVGTAGGNAKIGGSVKKYSTIVVGSTQSGHNAADVDLLCDGISDQVEMNNAISSLSNTLGGEIKLLDGVFNLSSRIIVNKHNVSIIGSNGTILLRMYNETSERGLIEVSTNLFILRNCIIDGNSDTYSSNNNKGLVLSGEKHNISRNIIRNNRIGLQSRGLQTRALGAHCIVNNICYNNSNAAIYIDSTNNIISQNLCYDNSGGIAIYSGENIVNANQCINNTSRGIICGDNSSITGNLCSGNDIGIYSAANSSVTGNTCLNNNVGISVLSNSVISGNKVMRGTGIPSDYNTNQYTIRITGNNNLIIGNSIMGKSESVQSGTGNTYANNKYE